MPRLAIIGEYNPNAETHRATDAAISHSSKAIQYPLAYDWIATDQIDDDMWRTHTGLLVAPGSPYRDFEKVLRAIRYARENGVPTLGTCGGFQHIIIEAARNIFGIKEAQHAEINPDASTPIIIKLACSLAGREMTLRLVPGSMVARIYGRTETKERYYCSFGVNPEFVEHLSSGPLRIVGSDAEGEIRVMELPNHPFFIGTLFVPQTLSTEEHPHPLFTAFLREVARER